LPNGARLCEVFQNSKTCFWILKNLAKRRIAAVRRCSRSGASGQAEQREPRAVQCHEQAERANGAERFSICDVLRSETKQNMGERSAASEPHILC